MIDHLNLAEATEMEVMDGHFSAILRIGSAVGKCSNGYLQMA